MGLNLTIREPEPMDVERVAVGMREIDKDECRAAGNSPWQGLFNAKRASVLVWTGEIDDRPEAMFGVVAGNALTGLGYPWFLGSEKARTAQRHFLRTAPVYLARIEALFPRLEGVVSARNVSAIRWLRYLGFVVEDHCVLIMRGEPMHRFKRGFDV